MEKPLFQNIDINQENPLTPVTPGSGFKFKIPKDPKILALIVMGGFIIVLAIIASITSSIRRGAPSQPILKKPTPTIAIPTTNIENFPTTYVQRFNQIDKEIQTDENFPPPQVDTNIGL